jgi:pilus assembly protein Flp/PilA
VVQLYAAVVSYFAALKDTREEGQGMVEYALIIALVAVALIGALEALTGGISGTFSTVTGKL